MTTQNDLRADYEAYWRVVAEDRMKRQLHSEILSSSMSILIASGMIGYVASKGLPISHINLVLGLSVLLFIGWTIKSVVESTCDISETDRFDRLVGICFLGTKMPAEAKDTSSGQMVLPGWARDWRKYSDGRYLQLEVLSRGIGAGIWGIACDQDPYSGRSYD